jgi:NADP-dependent 3-hydroxy acid dehydrogenase YdfG
MQNLENKVVLITGASSGFGEDAALLFAKEGCKVVLAARRIDRLQKLAAKIQDLGGEAIAVPVDLVDSLEVEDLVKATIDLYGQIDILFNNAGIGRVEWFENHSLERDINTLVQVNLIALMQVTHEVLPYMLARGEGHIIDFGRRTSRNSTHCKLRSQQTWCTRFYRCVAPRSCAAWH